jgi:hypothetical protein
MRDLDFTGYEVVDQPIGGELALAELAARAVLGAAFDPPVEPLEQERREPLAPRGGPRGLPDRPFWKRVCSGGRPLPTAKPASPPVVLNPFLRIARISKLALDCQYEICYDDQVTVESNPVSSLFLPCYSVFTSLSSGFFPCSATREAGGKLLQSQ